MNEELVKAVMVAAETSGKDGIMLLMQSDPSTVNEILIHLCKANHLLHRACILGDEELIIFLTAFTPDVNASSPLGTPLSLACEHGYESIVDILLCNKTVVPPPIQFQREILNLDQSAIYTACRFCPFFQAAANRWVSILKILIDTKPENFCDIENCKNLLAIACFGGYAEVFVYCMDTMMKMTTSKDLLMSFICGELLNLCLEWDRVSLLTYIICAKTGAFITADLADRYSASIGHFLEQFVFEAEADQVASQEDWKLTTDQNLPLVSIDWSGRSLHVLKSSWITSFVTCLRSLDLSYNTLLTIPDVIPWQLSNLHSFIASNSRLKVLPSPATGQRVGCERLQLIDLSNNLLSDLPVELFDLPSLEKLYLSNNQLSALYSTEIVESQAVQWGCVKLKELNVCHNSLDSLPFQIHSCVNLVSLHASHNHITDFVHPWPCPLKILDLSENEISDMPLATDDFWSKSLQILNLSKNSMTQLPQTICRLASLKDLDLSHNNISSLPNLDWWECCSLEILDLSHNKLGSLPASPTPISDVQRNFVYRINATWLSRSRRPSSGSYSRDELTVHAPSSPISFPKLFSRCLTDLNLSHNRLKEVPFSITDLSELTKLDLSYNPGLSSLPLELSQLKHLHTLCLDGLCLSDNNLNRHIQIASSGKVILAYMKQIHRQCIAYYRIKLMLVGNQEKGKTSLAYALRDLSRPQHNVATDGVEITEFKLSSHSKGLSLKRNASPDLTVQLWDFAGQYDYYVTHKVFLSSSALYLVIFDLRLGRQGVDGLHVWLSDIQAHAPDSNVIIVGTFLDCLSEGRNHLPDLHTYIQKKYSKRRGFPKIEGMVEVSNIGRKEGLDSLRRLVYDVALKIRVRIDNYGKVNLVGRMLNRYSCSSSSTLQSSDDRLQFANVLAGNLQIPKDYLELIKVLLKEAERCKQEGRWPVLNEEEFWKLCSSLSNSSISSKEEMELATQFLTESGYILHFVSSSSNGLEPLYFIDPQWLANMLAKFITVDSVQRFTRGGIINLKDAESALLFSTNKTNISFNHYVDLLESFDIALRMDDSKLLLPSKLPSIKPGFQKLLKPKSLRLEAGELHRIYKMNHVPSGFWSRLLVQILAAVCSHQGPMSMARRKSEGSGRRSTMKPGNRQGVLKEEHEHRVLGSLDKFADPKIIFWQEGIFIDCHKYHLLIEPVDEYVQSSFSPSSSSPSASDDDDDDSSLKHGIFVRVTKTLGEEDSSNLAFILAAFAIDYIDSLINQWYPGLLDEGCLEQLTPCPYCLEAKIRWSEISLQGVHMFSLIEFAKIILDARSLNDLTVSCPTCRSPQIHLKYLIPDLLLLDLPSHLHINASELKYDPITDVLGRGGEGTVFRGVYHNQAVAVKQSAIVQSCQSLNASVNAEPSEESLVMLAGESDLLISDFFWKSKTLSAFNGFRQETWVLAHLRHPCIISMLGVSAPTLTYIMELSPFGSLRQALLKNQELLTSSDREGRLQANKLLVYKIIYQVISGLEYLHSEGIVYKDLKPENILVWSLDVDDAINIKLSDYGLARRLTKQGLKGLEGTTGYQAPEIRQQKPYNEKVDIFAFAMVAHELATGEPLFFELSSVLINKFILQGKRPDNSGSMKIAPQMMSLIERCWAQNPSDRPSAADISSILQNLSFVCKEMVVSLEENRILSSVSFTYWNGGTGLHHPYLRFWTGNDSGRCYHVFNAAIGQFKIVNQCHPGPKVSCMILINKFMVIGTEHPTSLQVLGFTKTSNQLGKLSKPYETSDVPLLLLPRGKETDEVFVGFANSEFHLYALQMSSKQTSCFELKHSIHLSDNCNNAIICGLSFNNGDELWVSCGPDIVVVHTSSELIKIETRIQIFPLQSSGRHMIKRMCSHTDQVWCLSQRDSIVVELDYESRNVLCVLDCSQSNPLNKVISNFDWLDTLRNDAASSGEDQLHGWPALEKKDIHRKVCGRSGQGCTTSYRRKLLKRAKSRSTEKYKATAVKVPERVRSMCFVRDALWVGRENGDILVINVTDNNQYNFEHGQVLAILCVDGHENSFSIEHLVNMNDERVVATRVSRDVKTVRRPSTQFVVWSALGLDRISQYKQIWKLAGDETTVGKAKSVKMPSFFYQM